MDVEIGKGITMPVDLTKLGLEEFPRDSVQGHVVYIGLRNVLMDAHASVTKETNPLDLKDAARGMALKKLDALYRGEVRIAGTRTRESDPVAREAKRLADMRMVQWVGKAWAKGEVANKDGYATLAATWPGEPGESATVHLFRIRDIVAGSPKVQADAKAAVERVRSAPTPDLADLGL